MTAKPPPEPRRWLFADQLGPHFLDRGDQPVLLVESKAAFARRPVHRRRAHLLLSALRHRAAELGGQALLIQAGTYAEARAQVDEELSVCAPTSWAALRLVTRLPDVTVLPARGFGTTKEDWDAWVSRRGRRRLLMEDFYRDARVRLDILMDGAEPAGGRWNLDHDNREPPPKGKDRLGLPAPPVFAEDDIDSQVRRDLDAWQDNGEVRLIGDDGPREFPVTRKEALTALRSFVTDRLPVFGPQQDAMLAGDPVMAHSLLSPALNLGLLDPVECAQAAEAAYRAGDAPLGSVEGFVRQLIGWRDYVWNLYWHFGDEYRHRNALRARTPLPAWFADLDADAVRGPLPGRRAGPGPRARLRPSHRPADGAGQLRHPARLGPRAADRVVPGQLVDGYDWVMVPNVVGMSQHADGGLMATKPYLGGGAYIHKMSDFCGDCEYRPTVRLGPQACPFTAGYWTFLDRHADRFAANPRMARSVHGLARLADLRQVVAQEEDRGSGPP